MGPRNTGGSQESDQAARWMGGGAQPASHLPRQLLRSTLRSIDPGVPVHKGDPVKGPPSSPIGSCPEQLIVFTWNSSASPKH